jgi:hypothetical protein
MLTFKLSACLHLPFKLTPDMTESTEWGPRPDFAKPWVRDYIIDAAVCCVCNVFSAIAQYLHHFYCAIST